MSFDEERERDQWFTFSSDYKTLETKRGKPFFKYFTV